MDFKLLNDVSYDKKNLIREDPSRIKDWNPYLANMMLSLHHDVILFVDEVNCRPRLTPKQHYLYLLYVLPKKKRFAKKAKPKKMKKAEVIRDYYKYSLEKAVEVADLFTDADIKQLEEMMFTGGQV